MWYLSKKRVSFFFSSNQTSSSIFELNSKSADVWNFAGMSKCLDVSSNKMRVLTTDFWNCFFQNVQIFMVMIPRTRSLVSLYIIYIHKRFICSSGLKYIKKSNSGKPQIVCLKCFSLSKRNIETKYISQSVHFRTSIIHCTVFYFTIPLWPLAA